MVSLFPVLPRTPPPAPSTPPLHPPPAPPHPSTRHQQPLPPSPKLPSPWQPEAPLLQYLLVRLLEGAGVELGGEDVVAGQRVGSLLARPLRLLRGLRNTSVACGLPLVTGLLPLVTRVLPSRGVAPVVPLAGSLRSQVGGSRRLGGHHCSGRQSL